MTVSSPRLYICFAGYSHTIVRTGIDGLPTSLYNGANSFSYESQSISFDNKYCSCSGCMKLARTVLNISNCGCTGNFINMIYRVLTKFYQNLIKKQDKKTQVINNQYFNKFLESTIYTPKNTNIPAANAAPTIGPTIGTQEYFQSLSLLLWIGSKKCIILGPRSRAGLIA